MSILGLVSPCLVLSSFLVGTVPGNRVPGHSHNEGDPWSLSFSLGGLLIPLAMTMFHLYGWSELVPGSGIQTGNFVLSCYFLSACGDGVGWGSLLLGACQGAKALRPDGEHMQGQAQNGPKLPPSL